MIEKRKVVIVGAGPGGLVTGMLLANKGFDVVMLEKNASPGGRNAAIQVGDFKFDTGPTFLMMKFVLDSIFRAVGRNVDECLTFTRLTPMYRLHFADSQVDITDDHQAMKQEIDRFFPGEARRFDQFMEKEDWRFRKLFKCLIREYNTPFSMVNKNILTSLPAFSLTRSLYDALGDYFPSERLRIMFTFQSKYLGMSPWKCPALFTMIPYVEHAYGIYHVQGGLSEISAAMATAVTEDGGEIRYNATVRQVLVEQGRATGVELEDGTRIMAEAVVMNADFGYAATNLFPPGAIRKWTRDHLVRKNFSVSTFMLYLGVDKVYDIPHHNIVFSEDYIKNVKDLEAGAVPVGNASFYVRNTGRTDSTVQPPGTSGIYVLVPVPNLMSHLDWEGQTRALRDWVVGQMETRLGMTDLSRHIVAERIHTPETWQNDYNVFLGATFNLGHNLRQMLYFRPHNRFEEVRNVYLVGGGTHPGSGLPTIYESGVISAMDICERFGTACGEDINHSPP
jgi:phytoene desaturase